MSPFIGLLPFQWIGLLTAVMTLLLMGDTLAGHYRSGFAFRVQYAPLASEILLTAGALTASLAPGPAWANSTLSGAAWLALATGIIGFGFHHYYGMARKPGGYSWFLHYLMYGAPQLAPLALALLGLLGLVAARGLVGEENFIGLSMRAALLAVVAVGLMGAILQATILHYRGAFNNPMMYVPLTVPVLAVLGCAWMIVSPSNFAHNALTLLLWMTLLIGFIGLGMHLRGMGRQMGGLYVTLFNWLEGPPAWAPALFAGFASVGLIAVKLL